MTNALPISGEIIARIIPTNIVEYIVIIIAVLVWFSIVTVVFLYFKYGGRHVRTRDRENNHEPQTSLGNDQQLLIRLERDIEKVWDEFERVWKTIDKLGENQSSAMMEIMPTLGQLKGIIETLHDNIKSIIHKS